MKLNDILLLTKFMGETQDHVSAAPHITYIWKSDSTPISSFLLKFYFDLNFISFNIFFKRNYFLVTIAGTVNRSISELPFKLMQIRFPFITCQMHSQQQICRLKTFFILRMLDYSIHHKTYKIIDNTKLFGCKQL